MRAAVAERPDGPDGLVVREVPRPEPRAGLALVRVEAFGLNRSEYMTLRGWSGPEVTFPRILGIECVGVVEAVADGSAVARGTTVAAVMGGMGRAFDGGYAEYALLPERQLMTVETSLPWDVLGALPETFITAAGSLDTLSLAAGRTLLVRGATSSVGLACLELARAAGLRAFATTRSEAKLPALCARGAIATVLEGERFAERARQVLPGGTADAVVDLIGGRAVLDSLALVPRGGIVCNSGLLGGEWVIDDFEPIASIPSGRKLTNYQSSEAADASVGGPLLQAVVEQVERGTVDPGIDTVYSLDEIADAHRRMAAGAATGKLVVVTGRG
ncbi:MAG TPA: zinc-binding dehydrogenase [Gaiellales bacterium]|jgi:NADPH:quinone reductase-like Zn-dependent oxidoreductase|nr:zinc-binding dehydrogenase [Gaiellales bacterium]